MNRDKLTNWLGIPWVRALLALGLVMLIGCIYNADGAFWNWGTHRDLLRQVSVYGILACGMTLVIVSGGIDLAVGSVLALSAVIFSRLSLHMDYGLVSAVGITLLAGTLTGITSGTFIAKFRIQPFIATLAMMVFARGCAKWVAGGQKVSQSIQRDDGSFEYVELPGYYDVIGSRILGGNIAVVSLIFIFCFLFSWILLSKMRYGRYIFAVGGNEEASHLSGVPVIRVKLLAYGVSGCFAAIAGICQAAQELQGDPEAGTAYELTAIAMAVIGGNTLAGGRGGIGLTFLGILTIGYLEKILSINAVQESTRLMLTGSIIIAAVLLQRKSESN